MSYLLSLLKSELLDLFKHFRDHLVKGNYRKVCLTAHNNADPDAVASLIAIKELVKKLINADVEVTLPTQVSAISKQVLSNLNMTLESSPIDSLHSCDLLIIIDTSSSQQLGEIARYLRGVKYVVVDHHDINRLCEGAELCVYDPSRKSTSEIVTSIYAYLGLNIGKELSTLLITGILYDSKHLILADEVTFSAMVYLIKCGGSYREALKALRKTLGIPERIARLRGVARSHIIRVDNYLVAITCVGAYESSVARALIEVGADAAIVMSSQKGGCRVDIRCKEGMVIGDRYLGELIVNELTKSLGGEGGGHKGALGALVKANVPTVFNELIKVLRKYSKEFKVLEEGVCREYG